MNSELIIQLIFLVALFLAMTIHEFCHALSAYYLGDKTAQYAGRLTLNPLAHIDLFGTILVPLFLILSGSPILIGWAKPVPVNYNNLSSQKWGPAIVSVFGPLANLVFGLFSVVLLKIVEVFMGLGPNNLLVIFLTYLIYVNIGLMIFNLIPIPPLDGSKVLFGILPDKYINFKMWLERYGIIILLFILLFFPGLLSGIYIVIDWVFRLFNI
ncbi:MAG: site-2 protease family protein [Patescibacteria group bacterium]|nr:site-2 protease family protein [Patescibacteria group bacterium]